MYNESKGKYGGVGMRRIRCVPALALVLLCVLAGCSLRPEKPDSNAELALGGG